MRKALQLLGIAALALCAGCQGGSGEHDGQILANAWELVDALQDYSIDYTYHPHDLSELVPRYIERMPLNPITGEPTQDTGSEKFDPATSPGNVYYQKVLKNDLVINYSLYVFGEKGRIKILRRSPNAAF